MRFGNQHAFFEENIRSRIKHGFLIGLVCSALYNVIALADEPLRIISVDANATELLVAAEMAEHIVAADMTSQSLLAPRKLPDLGYHRSLSPEAIVSLAPDLVIGSDHMGPDTAITFLEKTDITLLTLPVPLTVNQLEDNIESLKITFGHEQAFNTLLDKLEQYQSTLSTLKTAPIKRMSFLLQLEGRGLSQAGDNTTGDALITLLSGDNIAHYPNYRPVSTEALLAEDPDVILIASEKPSTEAIQTLIKQFPLFEHSRAYQKQQIHVIPINTMIAGLSVSAVKTAAELAPHLLSDVTH